MPYDEDHRIIPLPVPQLQYHEQPSNNIMYQKSLTAQFCTMLQPWQQPLFGPIHKHQPTKAILQTSLNHRVITLVSDASVLNSKQNGFAWVITHKTMKLWKVVGVAPGPAEDIYSGRAEAFGLIMGLTFLQHYVKSYGPTNFHNTPLCCYCNNLGVITMSLPFLVPPSSDLTIQLRMTGMFMSQSKTWLGDVTPCNQSSSMSKATRITIQNMC